LYQSEAAFIPEVNGELDTQNFEKFEEVDSLVGGWFCVCLNFISNFAYSFVVSSCNTTAG